MASRETATIATSCSIWPHEILALTTSVFLSFFPRTSLSIFKFSPCNHTATQLTALCADAVMWVTLPVRKLPIFLILLSRTLHLREVCVKFSRSVVSASWWPKQPTALHWFTCGTTHPFVFPDKLPIFLSLVSWTCLLLLQSLWVN